MKKLLRDIYLLGLLIIFFVPNAQACWSKNDRSMANSYITAKDSTLLLKRRLVGVNPERIFANERKSLGSNFDFSLRPTTKGKFSLDFTHYGNTKVAVKIYDIIGNVIFEEKVSPNGRFSKEYDLSAFKTMLFIVEVGNAKYNKTKSIVSG